MCIFIFKIHHLYGGYIKYNYTYHTYINYFYFILEFLEKDKVEICGVKK